MRASGVSPKSFGQFSDNRQRRARRHRRKSLKIMAGPTRLELATSGVTGRRSNQLNYDPARSWERASLTGPRKQLSIADVNFGCQRILKGHPAGWTPTPRSFHPAFDRASRRTRNASLLAGRCPPPRPPFDGIGSRSGGRPAGFLRVRGRGLRVRAGSYGSTKRSSTSA